MVEAKVDCDLKETLLAMQDLNFKVTIVLKVLPHHHSVVTKSLSKFGIGYFTKARARLLESESTYRGFMRLSNNRLFILVAGAFL